MCIMENGLNGAATDLQKKGSFGWKNTGRMRQYIPDAYDCLMEAVEEGEIILQKYEDLSEASLQWIHQTMMKEYETASEEYQYFLRNHFAFLQSAHL